MAASDRPTVIRLDRPQNRRRFLKSVAAGGITVVSLNKMVARSAGSKPDGVPIVQTRHFDNSPKTIKYIPEKEYSAIQLFKSINIREKFPDEVHTLSFRRHPNDRTNISFVAHVEDNIQKIQRQNPSTVKGIPIRYTETEKEQKTYDGVSQTTKTNSTDTKSTDSFEPDDLRAGARIDTNDGGYATLTGVFFSKSTESIYLITAGHAATTDLLLRGDSYDNMGNRLLQLDGDDEGHDIGLYKLTDYNDLVSSTEYEPHVQETISGGDWASTLSGYWTQDGLLSTNQYDIQGHFLGTHNKDNAQFYECKRPESYDYRLRVRFEVSGGTESGDSGGPFVGSGSNLVTWLYDSVNTGRVEGPPVDKELDAINNEGYYLFAFSPR